MRGRAVNLVGPPWVAGIAQELDDPGDLGCVATEVEVARLMEVNLLI